MPPGLQTTSSHRLLALIPGGRGDSFLSLLLTHLCRFNFLSQGGLSTPTPSPSLQGTKASQITFPTRQQSNRDDVMRKNIPLSLHPRSTRHISSGTLGCPPGYLAQPSRGPAMQGPLKKPGLMAWGREDDPLYPTQCPESMGCGPAPGRAWLAAGRASLPTPESAHAELGITCGPGGQGCTVG